jgi:GNAT superfamily N-acetyltransferase
VTTVRSAEAGDGPFLEEMLAVAADWRDTIPRPVREVLTVPELAHYIVGWTRVDYFGVVAEGDAPVGAAWCRFFTADDPGYGFVDERTPEVSIGVVAAMRGRGVGSALLDALIGEARHRGLSALSLSVEAENPPRRLYRRAGFEEVSTEGGAITMVLLL